MLREGLNTPSKEQRLQMLENENEEEEQSYYDEEEDVGKGFDNDEQIDLTEFTE